MQTGEPSKIKKGAKRVSMTSKDSSRQEKIRKTSTEEEASDEGIFNINIIIIFK